VPMEGRAAESLCEPRLIEPEMVQNEDLEARGELHGHITQQLKHSCYRIAIGVVFGNSRAPA
jgi:hypothetical protein